MHRGRLPKFLAYGDVKVRVPGGRHLERKFLVYRWRSVVVFPATPVFHAQPVSDDPGTQYGALTVTPGRIFPKVRPLSYNG